jgi:hypothetical protein
MRELLPHDTEGKSTRARSKIIRSGPGIIRMFFGAKNERLNNAEALREYLKAPVISR